MPDLKLHHLSLAAEQFKLKRAIECVRGLLVVIKHEVAAHGRDAIGELETQSPTRYIHLMDTLVAQVTVPCVPDPMPVLMKPVAGERLRAHDKEVI